MMHFYSAEFLRDFRPNLLAKTSIVKLSNYLPTFWRPLTNVLAKGVPVPSRIIRQTGSRLKGNIEQLKPRFTILKEDHAGIGEGCYVPSSKLGTQAVELGFNCQIKQSADDFIVQEVDISGKIAYIDNPMVSTQTREEKCRETVKFQKNVALKRLHSIVPPEIGNKIGLYF